MELKDFIKVLNFLDNETGLTAEFDRKFGQEDNGRRWWDSFEHNINHSSQRHHVIGHFCCWYYQGAPSKCSKSNCGDCYTNIFIDANFLDYHKDKSGRSAKYIFLKMNRPEMYIYIAEVLSLFENKEDLKNVIEEVKTAMNFDRNNYTEGCNKAKDCILWEKIEENAEKILKTIKS